MAPLISMQCVFVLGALAFVCVPSWKLAIAQSPLSTHSAKDQYQPDPRVTQLTTESLPSDDLAAIYEYAMAAYELENYAASADYFRSLVGKTEPGPLHYRGRYLLFDSELRNGASKKTVVSQIEFIQQWVMEVHQLHGVTSHERELLDVLEMNAQMRLAVLYLRSLDIEAAFASLEQAEILSSSESDLVRVVIMKTKLARATAAMGKPLKEVELTPICDQLDSLAASTRSASQRNTLLLQRASMALLSHDYSRCIVEIAKVRSNAPSDIQLRRCCVLGCKAFIGMSRFVDASNEISQVPMSDLDLHDRSEALALSYRIARELQQTRRADEILATLAELGIANSNVKFAQLKKAESYLAIQDFVSAQDYLRRATEMQLDDTPDAILEVHESLTQYELKLGLLLNVALEQWEIVKETIDELPEICMDENGIAFDPMIRGVQAECFYRHQAWSQLAAVISQFDQMNDYPSQQWISLLQLRRAEMLAKDESWDASMRIVREIESSQADSARSDQLFFLKARIYLARTEFEKAHESLRQCLDAADGKSTELVPRAHWLQGEIYFLQRKYQNAVASYQASMRFHEHTQWVAASMLQCAKCFELMDEQEKARSIYSELSSHFPDSPHAITAQRRWNELQSNFIQR